MRAVLIALAFGAAPLPPPAAGTAAEERLAICIDAPEQQADAAAALDHWVGTARVEAVAPPCPVPTASLHVGRFRAAGGRIRFLLEESGGPRLEREVPWLDAVELPLQKLQRAGKLDQFSVIVEALLAERRLALIWANLPGAPSAEGAESPRGAEEPPRPAGGGAVPKNAARGSTVDAARGGASAGSDTAPRSAAHGSNPGAARDVGSETGDDASPHRPDGAGTVAAGSAASAAGASEASSGSDASPLPEAPAPRAEGADAAEPALDPSPGALLGAGAVAVFESAPAGGEAAPPDGPRTGDGATERARADSGTGPAPLGNLAPPSIRRPVSDAPIPIGLQASAGLRLRAPDVAAAEVAVGAEVGAFYLRASWQPASEWRLADLPVSVEGFGVEAGAHLLLLQHGAWSLRAQGGALLERLALRALYRPDGRTHAGWDAGPLLGGVLRWAPWDDLALGVGAAVAWMPTARRTHLGEDGPDARPNAVSTRLGIDLSWAL